VEDSNGSVQLNHKLCLIVITIWICFKMKIELNFPLVITIIWIMTELAIQVQALPKTSEDKSKTNSNTDVNRVKGDRIEKTISSDNTNSTSHDFTDNFKQLDVNRDAADDLNPCDCMKCKADNGLAAGQFCGDAAHTVQRIKMVRNN